MQRGVCAVNSQTQSLTQLDYETVAYNCLRSHVKPITFFYSHLIRAANQSGRHELACRLFQESVQMLENESLQRGAERAEPASISPQQSVQHLPPPADAGDKRGKRFNGDCYNCGQRGHKAWECRGGPVQAAEVQPETENQQVGGEKSIRVIPSRGTIDSEGRDAANMNSDEDFSAFEVPLLRETSTRAIPSYDSIDSEGRDAASLNRDEDFSAFEVPLLRYDMLLKNTFIHMVSVPANPQTRSRSAPAHKRPVRIRLVYL